MINKKCKLYSCKKEFEPITTWQSFCCKKCSKRAEYLRNKEKLALKWKQRYKENPEYEKQRQIEYYHKNKERINAKRKEKYKENPQPIKDKVNKYRLKNQNKVKLSKRNYDLKNKDKRNAKHNERYKTDKLYKLRFSMRNRLRNFLRDRGWNKNCETSKLIGCSYNELKKHLEKQFKQKMTWNNHGTYWHIDHIIPLAKAKNSDDLKKLCHWKNLQPLTIKENLKKGAK